MARSTFARAAYWLALALAVVVLTALFMKGFGLLQYLPGVGEIVYGTANALQINGDEGVEDFYVDVTSLVSLLAAVAIVAVAHRRRTARVRSRIARSVGID